MKRCLLPLSFLLIFILPAFVASLFTDREQMPKSPEDTVAVVSEIHTMIRVWNGDEVTPMELDEYVLQVLLGEMPADFETEALKAQAVATRTYTLRKVLHQSKHDDAHICTDAGCCQAFVKTGDYLLSKGSTDDLEKIQSAVRQTTGQVLTYQGNLIEATYFSCSGGMTEDAAAVWGTDVPYLQSVTSPGEENAGYYEKKFSYTCREFLSKLGLNQDLLLSERDIAIRYTSGGGVAQMHIAGTSYSGTQLRTLLGLPSTAFTVSVMDGNVYITTKGHGHRVGMSQYGADAMAVSGKKYEEILLHYYPGTSLVTFTQEQMQAVFDKAGNL